MVDPKDTSPSSGCGHIGGPELIEMSEAWLRERSIAEERWSGSRFAWGENVDSAYWKSVYIEIERREQQWVVTRIDRLNDILDETRRGFLVVASGWSGNG